MIMNLLRTIGIMVLVVVTLALIVATVYISMWLTIVTAVLLLAVGVFKLLQIKSAL